jgi:hypothetical protein
MSVMSRLVALMLVVLMVAAGAGAAVDVPLRDLKVAVTAGFTVKSSCKPGQVTFTFMKAGEERRLLAAQGLPAGDPTGALAAEISYHVVMGKGEAPRLAVIAWETDGGSWYKVAAVPVRVGEAHSGRVSMAGLTQTAFSEDTSGQFEWDNVSNVWVGFIFDGAAEGTALVTGARLTDTPVVPTQPVALINVSGKWNDGHDPAVKTTITNPAEGPGGKTCFKYEYDVPAGKHMYACPSAAIIAEDLEGYKALRFQLRSEIPEGMRLLVQMSEQGGPIYYIERPAPGPAEWTEITIPLAEFKPATWGPKDDNGQLDPAKLNTLSIGSHGVPANARLGLIMVCDVVFVP